MHRGGGDTGTKIGAIYYGFIDNGESIKTSIGNGLRELYNFSSGTIIVYNKMVFNLSNTQLHTSKGGEVNYTLNHAPAPLILSVSRLLTNFI